jgi:hypothetical protein
MNEEKLRLFENRWFPVAAIDKTKTKPKGYNYLILLQIN